MNETVAMRERVGALVREAPVPVLIHETICGVLKDAETGEVLERWQGKNLITNAGALYYAERGVKQSVPTNFTDGSGNWDGIISMGDTASPVTPTAADDYGDISPVANGTKVIESTYPKVNDTDPDNSGAGVRTMTYKYVFPTTFSFTGISEIVITNPSPGASEPILTKSIASSWTPSGNKSKTTSQTLTWYVNHTPAGV